LPPGAYTYEAYLEGGRERLEPLRVRATVRIAGDEVEVDLGGTSPQTAGPTNVGPAMAPTGAFTILKAFLDPGGEINAGAFRPLRVITPEGTLVNARRPAPCGGMVEVKYCVESAVMGALSQAIAGKVTGDIKGGGNHLYVGGPDGAGGTFIFYEYPAGGTGAFEGGDGSNAVRTFTESDITTIQPVEAVEQKYPLQVERCALRPDSGGNGRWRGGLGLVREVRLLAPEAQLSVLAEKSLLRPFGVAGGLSGAPNRFYVRRDGAAVEPSPLPGKVSGFPLQAGDVVIMESSGGGGYGDALERDPGAVAADLARGLISPAVAAEVYGVLVGNDGGVDAPATAARRQALRAARRPLRLGVREDLDEARVRQIALDPATAAGLGVRAGDVVEIVNPHGAPLRAWVAAPPATISPGAEVSTAALAMLGMTAGAPVEVRALTSSRPAGAP
jgi:N-methylhydantoinase B